MILYLLVRYAIFNRVKGCLTIAARSYTNAQNAAQNSNRKKEIAVYFVPMELYHVHLYNEIRTVVQISLQCQLLLLQQHKVVPLKVI